ncbi:MAG: hypothetical protein JSS39_01740 [Nitrospira sp.]|nr:hypothetical protein [Nitrospira sp.]
MALDKFEYLAPAPFRHRLTTAGSATFLITQLVIGLALPFSAILFAKLTKFKSA